MSNSYTNNNFVLHEKLNEDLFIIKLEDNVNLLYAPLRRRLVKITDEQANDVKDNTPAGETILSVNGYSDSTWSIPPAPDPKEYFAPNIPGAIMMSITNKCNLRCKYCFADGGEYKDVMPWQIAQSFLDLIPSAARRNGNQYSISFHGDGEVLTEPDLLWRICSYAYKLAEVFGFNLRTSITTNATLITKDNIDLVKRYISSVGVSFDGDEIAQSDNRPNANGESSFPALLNAVKLLKEHDIRYSFRATITKDSVKRMPEMVDFVLDVMGCDNIHFEPATSCNRAGSSIVPDPKEFIKYVKLAWERGKERGVTVFSAAAQADKVTQMFCGACVPGITLLANGNITSCSRITHPEDPAIDKYVFGWWNPNLGIFEFDAERITNLRTKVIATSYPECQGCFALWHCSGICPAVREAGDRDYMCEITQHLTLHKMLELYDTNYYQNQQEELQKNLPAEELKEEQPTGCIFNSTPQ